LSNKSLEWESTYILFNTLADNVGSADRQTKSTFEGENTNGGLYSYFIHVLAVIVLLATADDICNLVSYSLGRAMKGRNQR
jgi:hypothetical protein